MLFKTIILAALISVATGCAGFRSNQQPFVAPELLQSSNTTKVVVSFNWKAVQNIDRPVAGTYAKVKDYNEIFEKELVNSGCCIIASKGQQPDLVINGVVDLDKNTQTFLEGLVRIPAQYTFAIIPAWYNTYYDLSMTASHINGKNVSYKLNDHLLTVQWLPLSVLFVIGMDPIRLENKIIENIHRNFIYRLKRNGVLVK